MMLDILGPWYAAATFNGASVSIDNHVSSQI